jgi:S-adenosylmethionine synthetase
MTTPRSIHPSTLQQQAARTPDRTYLFTSESVSEGHPDKLADRISDSILDHYLGYDPQAKVAAECLVAHDLVVVAGEIHTTIPGLYEKAVKEIPGLVREVLRGAGYDGSFPGIDPDRCEVRIQLNSQSADIRQGVDQDNGAVGAGDQGMMFGYACDETPELMPLPIMLAHWLVQRQADLRRSGEIPWLRPDAKSQVSVRYRGDIPVAVETVVLSTQHAENVDLATVRAVVLESIISKIIPQELQAPDLKVLINPTDRFVIGGPYGDTGLTGRKIIVDTYGGRCPHGGGAFSGKDPSKVDRSAAYAARHVAKNIVAAKLARRCTVQIAYAIGVAEPVSLYIDTHGTGVVADAAIEDAVREVFDLTPAGIIRALDLRRPIYTETSAYGHFGRLDSNFSWERTNQAEHLSVICSAPRLE